MKLAVMQCIDALQILERMSLQLIKADHKLYLAVAEVLDALKPISDRHARAIDVLRASYHHVNKDGQPSVPDDRLEDFTKRAIELADETSDVKVRGRISLARFEAAGIILSGTQLNSLRWLVKLPKSDGDSVFEDDQSES